MTTYYVGPGGSDANAGTSYALRKLTLNGAEDIPVVAGDTVYVSPGVYREQLTCDVSGSSGNQITYIGDVSGINTDGVGGTVRVTGSDDDLTATRASAVLMAARNFRTFRGFLFDTTTTTHVSMTTTAGNSTIEDCVFQPQPTAGVCIGIASGVNVTVRRCVFVSPRSYAMQLIGAANVDNSGHVVENCLFLAGILGGINIQRVGGMTIRNNLFFSGAYGVRLTTAVTVGQTEVVANNIFLGCGQVALVDTVAGEITEDFNTFWGNAADRTLVNTGANSISAPPLFTPPQLLAGFNLPWPAFSLSEWSQMADRTGTGPPTDDFYGMARPAAASKLSWGPIQWVDQSRSSTQAHAGTYSLKLADAGRTQILIPVTAVSTTITVWVRREGNYAGSNPQMIVKQPGVADITITDAGGSGAWNQLTSGAFTPAATSQYVVVELVSRNTATSGSFGVYFDDLAAS